MKSNKLFAKAPGKMINCDGMSCDPRTDKLYVADSAANAIQVISPDGTVSTLAKNGDVTDKLQRADSTSPARRCFAATRSSCRTWTGRSPGFVNTKWHMPATLSVIKLK